MKESNMAILDHNWMVIINNYNHIKSLSFPKVNVSIGTYDKRTLSL